MKKLSSVEMKKISGGKAGWWHCFLTNMACVNTWDGNACLAYKRECL